MKKILIILSVLMIAVSAEAASKKTQRRYITPQEVHVTVSPAAKQKANEIYESVKKDYSQGKLSDEAVVEKALYNNVWSPELAEKCLLLVSDKNTRAKAELGYLYTYFKTAYLFPGKENEGVRLLQEAAGKGDKKASDYLGIYYNGKNDYKNAWKYFNAAGPDNIPQALTKIGRLYDDGKGVKRDRAKALEYYRRAALKGDADGAEKYGASLQRKWYGKVNMPDAFFWTYVAGELGDDFSRSNLMLPLRGERFGDDTQTAFVRNAMTLGNAWNDQYGHPITSEPIYKEGYVAGLEPRIKAADTGDVWSLFYLGSLSYNNEFLKRKDDFVTKCYEPIVQLGGLPAPAMALVYERLAQIYRDGTGVQKDSKKADEYARKGADLGSLAAYKIVENIPN